MASLLEEALLGICGPLPEWGGNPSAASLGMESDHDHWEEFGPLVWSDDDNGDTNANENSVLSKSGQQASAPLKDEEQKSTGPGKPKVYNYPTEVTRHTATLPAADPMQGYIAARRRLRQWEAGGVPSKQQQKRRSLSASGGSAGLLRLTRRSKGLVPLPTTGTGAASAYAAGTRAFSRSSTILTTSVSFGSNTSDPIVARKASPPRQPARIAIYT